MEIIACEKCGSPDTSEDLSTGQHTCLKCGFISKGVIIDFLGMSEKEKPINPRDITAPFSITTRIKNTKKLL